MTKRGRFERLKYGLFVHYVPSITCDGSGRFITDIDELADGFDCEKFALDVSRMGAEYVIFTAWHYETVPLYPSKVMQRWRPGKCSGRDLIGDMIAALKKYGIEILLYTHPRDGHDFNRTDQERTGWGVIPGEGDCYKTIDYTRLRRTIREIDPELVLIQNFYGSYYCCDLGMQEYGPRWYEFKDRDGSRWPGFRRSVAAVIAMDWMAKEKREGPGLWYSAEDLFRYTLLQASVNDEGGGVAWAAGPYPFGEGWENGVEEALCRVGGWLNELGDSFRDTLPSTAWPTGSGHCLADLEWGVALSSRDRKKEYLHLLKERKDPLLRLPEPADGTEFADAVCFDGTRLPFRKTEDGYELDLSGWKEKEEPADCPDGRMPDRVVVLTVSRPGEKRAPLWLHATDRRICYDGDWQYNRWGRCWGEYEGGVFRCTRDGSWFQMAFEGRQIQIIGDRHEELGECDIYLDDVYAGRINQYSTQRQVQQVVFSSGELYGGLHRIRAVKVSGTAMELSALAVLE